MENYLTKVAAADHHKELISCQIACPVHTDARGYVRAIADGDFERAYLIARGPNPFASICGRVCGAPCELSCRRGKIPRTDDDGSFVAMDRPVAASNRKIRNRQRTFSYFQKSPLKYAQHCGYIIGD